MNTTSIKELPRSKHSKESYKLEEVDYQRILEASSRRT
jgi:hypothetical protein